jgi:hypothetical protein
MPRQINKPSNLNNEEESYITSGLASKIDNMRNNLKEELDKASDFRSCIEFLYSVVEAYNKNIIPYLKEMHQNPTLKRELFLSLYQKTYDIYSEVYKQGLKKAESFGADPSEVSPEKFPKSLEKLTFPESN